MDNLIDVAMNRATEQMNTYKPADHEVTRSVAPLVQFFELVHLGDTIQSIVQVYFDKELVRVLMGVRRHEELPYWFAMQAPHIDRTDFLNPVVREKKRFENALDDSVAAGLNAGTHVLMNQVRLSFLIHMMNIRLTTAAWIRWSISF
jgi:recyclin-1